MGRVVRDKRHMYELLAAGEFGNAFRQWPSVEAAEADGYDGPFGLRLKRYVGRHWMADMSRDKVLGEVAALGRDAEGCSVCEWVPNDLAIVNCEVQRKISATDPARPMGLHVRYRKGGGHMRAAMNDPLHVQGVEALVRLRGWFGQDGWEALSAVLDEWDGRDGSESAVVEATAFWVPVGPMSVPWVVWEVRSTY